MLLNKSDYKNNKTFVFYCLFFLFALLVHFLLPLGWADDVIFREKVSRLGLLPFLNNSARPLVDALTYIFAKYPVLWRISNPLVLIVLSRLLSYYLPECKNEYAKNVTICSVLIYPSLVVVDAGFIATTVNYLWPVTMGLLCLLPFRKKLDNRKIYWWEMILLVPCLLYATNMQQMAVTLVLLLGTANVYLLMKKKFSPYVMFQFLVTICCSVYSYIINTVGDNPRMLRETGRYFPEFGSLNLFEKIELGFSSTFYCLTMKACFAWVGFIAFLIILAVFVYKKSKKVTDRAIVTFPVVFSLWGIIQDVCSEGFGYIKQYIPGDLQNYKMNKAVYSFEPISDIFFVIVILCILYSLYVVIRDKKQCLISCAAFFVGTGTRMIMGFSPTVWASGYRTFYIMFLSLIVVSFFVINRGKSDVDVK